jgi:hypothetical protein
VSQAQRRDDAQVGVLGLADGVVDGVDVECLVLVEAVLRNEQFTIRGKCRAVTVGQVVDHDLNGVDTLSERCVEVPDEAVTVAIGAVDGINAVQPHEGWETGNLCHLRAERATD